jgi:hypothetical protein
MRTDPAKRIGLRVIRALATLAHEIVAKNTKSWT